MPSMYKFKNLAGKKITINKVFPFYRSGWNDKKRISENYILKDGVWYERTWENNEMKLEKKDPNWSVHKKVFDMEVELDSPHTETIRGEEVTDTTWIVRGVSASKIGDICSATVAFGKDIEQIETKSGDKRNIYDREDEFVDKLEGVRFQFSTTGTGLNTKYTYKDLGSAPVAKEEEEEDEDFPF